MAVGRSVGSAMTHAPTFCEGITMKSITALTAAALFSCLAFFAGCAAENRVAQSETTTKAACATACTTAKKNCSNEAACAEGKVCSKGEACCNAKKDSKKAVNCCTDSTPGCDNNCSGEVKGSACEAKSACESAAKTGCSSAKTGCSKSQN
jgi:hypothetical protein